MRSMRDGLFGVLAGVLLACLVGVGTARADASSGPTFTGPCIACSGTFSGQEVFTVHSTDSNGYPGTTVETVNWTQKIITGPVVDQYPTATAEPPVVSGSINYTTSDPDQGFQSCSITLTSPTSGPPSGVTWSDLGKRGVQVAYAPPGAAEMPNNCTYLAPVQSGDWTGQNCHYNTGGLLIQFNVPLGESRTQTDNCSYTESSNAVSEDFSADDSVTFRTGGAQSSGIPKGVGPNYRRAKEHALADLRRTIDRWGVSCVGLGASGSLVASGVVLSALPGGAGAVLAVAGGLNAAALAPACGPAIARGVLDYKAYKDPPLPSIHTLAEPAKVGRSPRLPACGGRAHPFCVRLRAAWERFDAAQTAAELDAAGIEKTISREHAAADAHKRSAVTAQDRDLGKLITASTGAERAETAAARAVASVLRSAHLKFRLSEAQDTKLDDQLIVRLARQGISAGDLAASNLALKPRAMNLLSALG